MGSDDRSTLATTKNSTCASISTIDCNQRDALEYLADLVLELKAIAEPFGLETLTGLLDLAHREALAQSRHAETSK